MQKTRNKSKKIEPKSRNPYFGRLDSEMEKIVHEIISGLITIRGACNKYGLCPSTLKLFISKHSIRTFDVEKSNNLNLIMNEDQLHRALIKKIQELTKDLDYAKLKIIGLETLIKVAEDDLNIKIRKKLGTKQLKK